MKQPFQQLARLGEAGILGSLDLHFARFLCRLAGQERWELALAAALTSSWTAAGHVCLDLAQVAGRTLPLELDGGCVSFPSRRGWERALRQTPVVGAPGDYTPLVLDHAGRLYLHRYWAYERGLATRLKARASEPILGLDLASLGAGLAILFPAAGVRPDWQKVAAALALVRRFSVISGGPGTGKTSTVVRILALLRQQPGGMDLDIALAAPTGKAAVRMQESIRGAKQSLPLAPAVIEAIPEQAQTLHRLLGWNPVVGSYHYHRDNPLPLDVLILDEASMVDLAMMARLVDAMPPAARLILLGDRNQLASVEAGAVLGDICGTLPGFSRELAAQLRELTGEQLEARQTPASPIADSLVLLRHSYRFGADSGIGRLAEAVNMGQGQRALALLQGEDVPDIGWLGPDRQVAPLAAAGYRDYLQALRAGRELPEVFRAFERFRVLCALREGDSGVAGLNLAIERALQREGLIDPSHPWYPGRPVMVTRNDYGLHLYNGDIGLVVVDPGCPGRRQVCFLTEAGRVRRLAAARLPAHDTAYAMSVHKSQGSEFERVLLVLPVRDNPLLTRELIYTAITRARRRFEVQAPVEALEAGIRRRVQRASGLREELWGDQGPAGMTSAAQRPAGDFLGS